MDGWEWLNRITWFDTAKLGDQMQEQSTKTRLPFCHTGLDVKA